MSRIPGDETFYQSPSGRLHLLSSCSGGATRDKMRKVKVTPERLAELLAEPGYPGLCRCAYRKAQRVTGWSAQDDHR